MRPQRDLLVPGLAREPHAFVGQPRTETEAAAFRIDQQQADARGIGRSIFHQHDAADVLAVYVGDPAALARRIIVVDEVSDDLRAQTLERIAPAVFVRIIDRVRGDHPAEVAMSGRAQGVSRRNRRVAREQGLDRLHRADQLRLPGGIELCQHRRDGVLRSLFRRRIDFAALRGQRKVALPCVGLRRFSADQAFLLEIAQQARQVPGVEIERADNVAGGQVVAFRQFVQHAHFAERVGAVEIVFAQDADLPRVEAVEAAHRIDAGGVRVVGFHGAHSVGQIVD